MSSTQMIPRQTADAAATRQRRPAIHHEGRTATWFLLPFIALYLLFIIGPAIYGLVMSFTNASLVKGGLNGFAGLANYKEALQSSHFWSSRGSFHQRK